MGRNRRMRLEQALDGSGLSPSPTDPRIWRRPCGGGDSRHSVRRVGDFRGSPIEKRQMACKPGSVPGCPGDGHSSGTFVAERLARPTRTTTRKQVIRHPYLVLLPVGLAVPRPLPCARCALTAPFHPCSSSPLSGLRRSRPPGLPRRSSVSCKGGFFSVALSLGSPPPDVIRHRISVEPGLSSRSFRPQRPSGHLTRSRYKPNREARRMPARARIAA
jgi:hypothetical protein